VENWFQAFAFTYTYNVCRYSLEIVRHVPESFWVLAVEARAPPLGRNLPLSWERSRVFDADVGEMFRRMASDAKHAKVGLQLPGCHSISYVDHVGSHQLNVFCLQNTGCHQLLVF
jgi:hypothetical protein